MLCEWGKCVKLPAHRNMAHGKGKEAPVGEAKLDTGGT